jgi:uncharacterized membrane protein (Fun14 family)
MTAENLLLNLKSLLTRFGFEEILGIETGFKLKSKIKDIYIIKFS